jgi:hypothetical protein
VATAAPEKPMARVSSSDLKEIFGISITYLDACQPSGLAMTRER